MSAIEESKTDASKHEDVPKVDGFNENVFLTSIRDGGRKEVTEPDGMMRVRDLHGKVNEVVMTLNDKVNTVLQRQEKEFLAAYRAHMYQVQKELQMLRAKANEAKLQLQKNEKIRSLEEERDWYRKEALRLDKFSAAMKTDLKYMKEKLDALEEDRNWLERQLKGCKKSNKLLRAELELRIAREGGDESPSGHQESSMFPPAVRSRRPQSGGGASTSSAGRSNRQESFAASERPAVPAAGVRGSTDPTTGAAEAALAAKYQTLIDKLESQLGAERRKVNALRAATMQNATRRADLQSFFQKCIDDVKRDVQKRKMRAAASSSGGAAGMGRPESPTLNEFGNADRRRVIKKLLSDDYVLEQLHALIFRQGREPPSTADLEGSAGAGFEFPVPMTDDDDEVATDGLGRRPNGLQLPPAGERPMSSASGVTSPSRMQLDPAVHSLLYHGQASRPGTGGAAGRS